MFGDLVQIVVSSMDLLLFLRSRRVFLQENCTTVVCIFFSRCRLVDRHLEVPIVEWIFCCEKLENLWRRVGVLRKRFEETGSLNFRRSCNVGGLLVCRGEREETVPKMN